MQKGFIALTSILIIGALILVISVGLSLRSVSEAQISVSEQESHVALALANLCAETALMKLEGILNYNGNEMVDVDGVSCDIMNIEGSGNLNRTVKAKSTVSGYAKKVKVVVSKISPVMQITSWEEVADF